MTDAFIVDVLGAPERSRQFIAETGGLPEIARASRDLMAAIRQTGAEIEGAVMASRFPREPSQYFLEMMVSEGLTQESISAIEEEGEAGHKRVILRAKLRRVKHDLHMLIGDLTELRTDLILAQRE